MNISMHWSTHQVLSDAAVAPRLSETKAAGEVKALEEFFEMMRNDPDRAFYGYKVSFSFTWS